MPTDVETLMEMGFSENRAQKALHKTGYKGVQVAMDWLFAHDGDPDIDDPFEVPKGNVLGKSGDQPSAESGPKPETEEAKAAQAGDAQADGNESLQAKSLKCEDCGRLLRTVDEAEFHAAKTGHANFSESTEEKKPLTEEERREQLAKVQEKLKQKRVEKQEQEKKEALQREKMRRITGKEMAESKARMQELEMKKLVEQRRRDKEEEKLARQKVREQIEKDKKERAKKFAKAGTAADSEQPTAAASPPAASVAATTSPQQAPVKKDYDQCRIQIRLTNGQALTQSFGAKEPLAAVRLYIEMNRTDGEGSFQLMTSFPRKVFKEEDMERPLTDLGLVPSAVLIVTK